MKDLDFLTHYYQKGEPPFRTLTELPQSEALAIIKGFDPEEALVFNRFRNPQKYMQDRKRTENWLHSEFISIGGRPKKTKPYYLVLGTSSYIQEGYNLNCNSLKIALDSIDLSEVSFTYPDSMVSLWLKENGKKQYNSRYHGRVFTYDDLLILFDDIRHKDNIWKEDQSRAYDFFIEAQLWSDKPIKEYLRC